MPKGCAWETITPSTPLSPLRDKRLPTADARLATYPRAMVPFTVVIGATDVTIPTFFPLWKRDWPASASPQALIRNTTKWGVNDYYEGAGRFLQQDGKRIYYTPGTVSEKDWAADRGLRLKSTFRAEKSLTSARNSRLRS